ncbi:MAG: flagellar hook-associated protein FlgK [Clostridia bacterium]|nr:MAG: flagellar hook-associated protein FlgK [Clostridia bacterium]
MTSAFFGINIALRGLQAQQKGLEVSSHNVANANTPGFTRQRAVLEATTPFPVPALNRPLGPGQLGTGVEAAMIDRIRDAFLDAQIRYEQSSLGRWEEKSQALAQVETVFMEPGETGLATLLNQFWDSWQELSKYPESAPVRTTVVETANALAEALRHTYQQLQDIQDNLETSLSIQVDQVNTLTSQIAALNRQIQAIKLAGDQPNDLLDQRDKLLDELSQVLNIQVELHEDGSVTVTGAGVTLVDGDQATELSLDILNVTEEYGGNMLGLHEAWDLVGEYKDDLDAWAKTLAREVNGIHQDGYGLREDHNVPFFVASDQAVGPLAASTPYEISGAANIYVNQYLVEDVTRVAAAASTPVAPGDGTKALEIAQLRQQSVDFGGSSQTIDDFYRNLVARLGINAHEASRMVENQTVLVDQLRQRRDSLSGVSLDEEMAGLIQFQRAYEAAARVITTMDSLLDTIINRMAV